MNTEEEENVEYDGGRNPFHFTCDTDGDYRLRKVYSLEPCDGGATYWAVPVALSNLISAPAAGLGMVTGYKRDFDHGG